MVLGHHHRRGQRAMKSFQWSYTAWSPSHSSCTHKQRRDGKNNKTATHNSCLKFCISMHSHWPNTVVICIDIIRLVELSIMQAGALVSRHTFTWGTQVLSSGTETALLTHPLPLAASLSARQRTTSPVTHTPTCLIDLSSCALQRCEHHIRGGLVIYSH